MHLTGNTDRPGFTWVDDGIMHGPGLSPVQCECGKVIPEAQIAYHETVCSILHMQRVVFAKNHKRKNNE